MTDEVRTENWVAKKLGIGRDAVRTIRAQRLIEGTDWTRERQAVVYTTAGLEKIAEIVQCAMEEARADTYHCCDEVEPRWIGPAPEVAAPQVEPWVNPPEGVWRPFTPDPVVVVKVLKQARNPRVLYGELEDKTPVCIQVPVSPLWRPGMQLPCVRLNEGQVEYRGRKPRSWSRWV